jgi:hypothetical protein
MELWWEKAERCGPELRALGQRNGYIVGLKGRRTVEETRGVLGHNSKVAVVRGEGKYQELWIYDHGTADSMPLEIHKIWDASANTREDLLLFSSIPFHELAREHLSSKMREIRTGMEDFWGRYKPPTVNRVGISNMPLDPDHETWNIVSEVRDELEENWIYQYTGGIGVVNVNFCAMRPWSRIFGGIFDSVVVHMDHRMIHIPNGAYTRFVPSLHEATRKWLVQHEDWVKMLGFTIDDLAHGGPHGSQLRMSFNIASAYWASLNYGDLGGIEGWTAPKSPDWADKVIRDSGVPKTTKPPTMAKSIGRRGSTRAEFGDMVVCDKCSLFSLCKSARVGSICTLRESEMTDLAEQFNTRDANKIIGGLGRILEMQVERAEGGMAAELIDPEVNLDPEVTKLMNSIFDRGAKLAKMLDPKLNGGPKFAVNVMNQPSMQIESGNARTLMAGVVAELEASGVSRDQITTEMVMQAMTASTDGYQPLAIETTVAKEDDPASYWVSPEGQ